MGWSCQRAMRRRSLLLGPGSCLPSALLADIVHLCHEGGVAVEKGCCNLIILLVPRTVAAQDYFSSSIELEYFMKKYEFTKRAQFQM